MTEQQLVDLADFETSAAFTELEKLVLRYAVAMTRTPVDVPDELFAGLRRQLNPQQMVELTSAIAWENYRARFDHAFGIEAEGFSGGLRLRFACPWCSGRWRSSHLTTLIWLRDFESSWSVRKFVFPGMIQDRKTHRIALILLGPKRSGRCDRFNCLALLIESVGPRD